MYDREAREALLYKSPQIAGPSPPDEGTRLLIVLVKEMLNPERARLRYWISLRCDRAGMIAETPESPDVVLTGDAALIARGLRELAVTSRAYFRRWLIAWYAHNGWLREPPFLTRRRIDARNR